MKDSLLNLGRNAQSNRMLAEYYEIVRTRGKDVADAIYDVYENAGRFAGGPTQLDRATDVVKKAKNSKIGQKAIGYVDEAAEGVTKLVDQIPLGKGGAVASRMAGSKLGQLAAKGLPVLGAVTAVGDVADILTNDTSLANKAMDTAAMGVGGTIGGVLGLGNPLAAAAGASTGKLVSDGLQFLLGGGKSAEQRKLEEAIALLNGGRL